MKKPRPFSKTIAIFICAVNSNSDGGGSMGELNCLCGGFDSDSKIFVWQIVIPCHVDKYQRIKLLHIRWQWAAVAMAATLWSWSTYFK